MGGRNSHVIFAFCLHLIVFTLAPKHKTPKQSTPSHLGALGLVVLAVHRVGRRDYTAASIEASMDACLGDGHRLLLHDLKHNRTRC